MKRRKLDIEVKRNGVIIYSNELPIGCYTYNQYGIIKSELIRKCQSINLMDMLFNLVFVFFMIIIINLVIIQTNLSNRATLILWFLPSVMTATNLLLLMMHYKINNLGGLYVAISKMLNVFEKKHCVPNIKSIRYVSPFRYSSNVVVKTISLLILEIFYGIIMTDLYSLNFEKNVLYSVLLLAVAFILSRVSIVNILFSPLQCIIFSKPSYEDIKLARKAVENFAKMESKIKQNYGKSNFWLNILYS